MSQQIRYRLDDLGWYQFETLCQSLLRSRYGISVEAWGGSGDWGRDAFSESAVKDTVSGDEIVGPICWQAKFVSGANATGAKAGPQLLKAVRDEVVRIKLRKIPSPATYVLMTNCPVSKDLRAKVKEKIKSVLPNADIHVLGGLDLCSLLDDAPRIRVSFPQLLGLADLKSLIGSIVAKPVLERSRLELERSEELAQVFVPTEAYSQALNTLGKYGFVVLTGPPEMGKTTIARIIALAMLGEGRQVYECREPKEVFQLHDRKVSQVFVADDAFGATEYTPRTADLWGEDLDRLFRLVDHDHWLIMTSRPAPLQVALERMHLQGQARLFPKPIDVTVAADLLSPVERALIVYRHAKRASMTRHALDIVKLHIKEIVSNSHFTPERIRRMMHDRQKIFDTMRIDNPKKLSGQVRSLIANEIATPTEAMRKSLHALPPSHMTVLIAILDVPPDDPFEADVSAAYDRHRTSECKLSIQKCINQLDGHFLEIADIHQTDGARVVAWTHPSFRDMLIEYVAEDAGRRQQFMKHMAIDGVQLALSVGGGASGSRDIPLLVNNDDVRRLDERVVELLDCDADLGNRVCHAIHVLIHGRPEIAEERADDLANLLQHVSGAWESSETPIDTAALEYFIDCTLQIGRLVPVPSLVQTFDYLWAQASNGDLGEVLEFLKLVSIARNADPRLLILRSYPEEYIDQLHDCLDAFSSVEESPDPDSVNWGYSQYEEGEWESDCPVRIDEAEERITECEDALGLLADIAEFEPGIAEEAEAISEGLEKNRSAWEQWVGMIEGDGPDQSGSYRAIQDSGTIDVGRIVSDL